MSARIQAHQASRPAEWGTLEEPIDLVSAMTPAVSGYDTVLLGLL